MSGTRVDRVRTLNDAFRTSLQGGRVMMTAGVQALGSHKIAAAFATLQRFNKFTSDNDPHNEHDFGTFEVVDTEFFFKIDYYDKDMLHGSQDPGDPARTVRVLTLMLASEC